MAQNDRIRTLYIGVHLGNPPSFEISADQDPTVTRIDCHFHGQGVGQADVAFLLEVLHKIAAAYPGPTPVSLCLQGTTIVQSP